MKIKQSNSRSLTFHLQVHEQTHTGTKSQEMWASESNYGFISVNPEIADHLLHKKIKFYTTND